MTNERSRNISTRMGFGRWLREYSGDDEIGDLAASIREEWFFPRCRTLGGFVRHLNKIGWRIEPIHEAWQKWRDEWTTPDIPEREWNKADIHEGVP